VLNFLTHRASSLKHLFCLSTSFWIFDAKNDAAAALQTTDEWLNAPRCLMQISVQLAFSYTKRVLLVLKAHLCM